MSNIHAGEELFRNDHCPSRMRIHDLASAREHYWIFSLYADATQMVLFSPFPSLIESKHILHF